jgi:hypothetical protein
MDVLPKYQSILLMGLAQAYASPSELPLYLNKSQPGLFPNNALGKGAAQAGLQSGFLEIVRTERRGKTTISLVRLSEAGCVYLLEQPDPKLLLEQVQAQFSKQEVALRQVQLQLRTACEDLEKLRTRLDQLTTRIAQQQVTQTRVTVPAWEDQLARYLNQRQQSRPAEDCPLPELYEQAQQTMPGLSVGSFHDGLRRLQSEARIALQPWTGPLHELPVPDLALLQGHSLAFYASSR